MSMNSIPFRSRILSWRQRRTIFNREKSFRILQANKGIAFTNGCVEHCWLISGTECSCKSSETKKNKVRIYIHTFILQSKLFSVYITFLWMVPWIRICFFYSASVSFVLYSSAEKVKASASNSAKSMLSYEYVIKWIIATIKKL